MNDKQLLGDHSDINVVGREEREYIQGKEKGAKELMLKLRSNSIRNIMKCY